MKNKFKISGFKCFENEAFELKNLTILCGNNGTGKSSLIQALLLIRLAIESNLLDSTNNDYKAKKWKGVLTPLNLGYGLSLGTIYDIFNQKSESSNKIIFELDDDKFEILFPSDKDDDYSINIFMSGEPTNYSKFNLPFWRKKEFYYLHTERLGPQFILSSNFQSFPNCGIRGEYVAQTILEKQFSKIPKQRIFENSSNINLPAQVNLWLNYICPDTIVTASPLGAMHSLLKLRNNAVNKDNLAPNMGFGISYAIPIIITGLIAVKGSIVIIENPEAHLHPKGQSNIGYFLGKIASSGIKIIIETHSEHIINGIRRAILSTPKLNSDDVIIYFFNAFNKLENRISKININPNGDLSDFPLDFFDQARQDLFEILKLSNR
jgi:predicted ATPase